MTPPKETTIIQPGLEEDALLPCPFCEAVPQIDEGDVDGVCVTCPKCRCDGPWADGADDPIVLWNTRVQPAPVEQDVERLGKLLDNTAFRAPRALTRSAYYEHLARAALSTLTPARAEGFKAGLAKAESEINMLILTNAEEAHHEWLAALGFAAERIRALGSANHG